MLNPTDLFELLSGRRRGPRAAAVRLLLRLGEIPYTAVATARNRAYDAGWRTVHRVPVPVISVGNLTTGGTGKTPVVAWIARHLQTMNLRVALLSRGYGAEGNSRNDEALELELQLPGVPHIQAADRVAGAMAAIREWGAELLLLDDAFQHRRLGRDLDIVLIDALEPFGFGHLLPRGLLRETLAGLRRAHVVIMTRADMVDAPTRQAIWQRTSRWTREALRVELAFRPSGFWDGRVLEPLRRGTRVAAFCGIGNPEGFRRTLHDAGLDVVDFRAFPDHYAYGENAVANLTRWAQRHDQVAVVVCTRKDWVKLRLDRLDRLPLRAICVEPEFLSGGAELAARLEDLGRAAPRSLTPPETSG